MIAVNIQNVNGTLTMMRKSIFTWTEWDWPIYWATATGSNLADALPYCHLIVLLWCSSIQIRASRMFLKLYRNVWILKLVLSQHNRHMSSFLYVDLPSYWMKIPNKILTHLEDFSLESTSVSFQSCILDQCVIFRRLPLCWHWSKFEKCGENLCQAGSLQTRLLS